MLTELDIKKIADTLVEKFHPVKLILFGSYARGRARDDSDVDLLVVADCPETECRTRAAEIRISLWGWRHPFDIIVRTPRQFEEEKDIQWTVVHPAVKEGRVLYE